MTFQSLCKTKTLIFASHISKQINVAAGAKGREIHMQASQSYSLLS